MLAIVVTKILEKVEYDPISDSFDTKKEQQILKVMYFLTSKPKCELVVTRMTRFKVNNISLIRKVD